MPNLVTIDFIGLCNLGALIELYQIIVSDDRIRNDNIIKRPVSIVSSISIYLPSLLVIVGSVRMV